MLACNDSSVYGNANIVEQLNIFKVGTVSSFRASLLRWAQAQQAEAEAAAQIRQAGQVAAWKCEAWLQSMQRLQASSTELAAQLDQLWDQLLASEQARAAAEAKLEHQMSDQVSVWLLLDAFCAVLCCAVLCCAGGMTSD